MPRTAKLTREAVLRAALHQVDSHGLEALTMRSLGRALGVEAMSLYRHVPNRVAVLDGIHEAVLDNMPLPKRTANWRRDTRALATAFRAALEAHPNALPLFATRPAVTQGALAYVERALTILQVPFPDLRDRVSALQALVTFCIGQSLASFAASNARDGVTYAQLPKSKFPILSSLDETTNPSADDAFAFGLDALLCGFETLSSHNA